MGNEDQLVDVDVSQSNSAGKAKEPDSGQERERVATRTTADALSREVMRPYLQMDVAQCVRSEHRLLAEWYRWLSTTPLDVANDIAGPKSVYLVNGDSLIAHVLNSVHPKFQTEFDLQRAVGYLRRTLKILQGPKDSDSVACVKVFFIDQMAAAFASEGLFSRTASSRAFYAIARSMIESSKTSMGFECISFGSWTDKAFAQFVSSSDAACLFVCDEPFSVEESKDASQQAADESAEVYASRMAGFQFHALSLYCVTSLKMRVGILQTCERQGSRLLAQTLGQSTEFPDGNEAVTKAYEKLQRSPEWTTMVSQTWSRSAVPSAEVAPFSAEASAVKAAVALLADAEPSMVDVVGLGVKLIMAAVCSELEHVNYKSLEGLDVDVTKWAAFGPDRCGYFDQMMGMWLECLTEDLSRKDLSALGDVSAFSLFFDGVTFQKVSILALLQENSPQSLSSGLGWTECVMNRFSGMWGCVVKALPAETKLPAWLVDPEQVVHSPEIPSVPMSTVVGPRPVASSACSMPLRTDLNDRCLAALRLLDKQTESIEKQIMSTSNPGSTSSLTLSDSMASKPTPMIKLAVARFTEDEKKQEAAWRARVSHMAPGKIAARMEQYRLKSSQREMKHINQYARSLAGADSLHIPVGLLNNPLSALSANDSSEPRWNKAGQAEDKASRGEDRLDESAHTQSASQASNQPAGSKLSKKAQEIIAKNIANKDKERANKDEVDMKPLMAAAAELRNCRDLVTLGLSILDLCAGFSRLVDTFDGFRGIAQAVKTPKNQAKVVHEVIVHSYACLDLLRDNYASHMASVRVKKSLRSTGAKLVRLCVTFVRDLAGEMTPEYIKNVQKLLLALGFKRLTKALFQQWALCQAQKSAEDAAAGAGAGAEGSKTSKADSKKESKKSKFKSETAEVSAPVVAAEPKDSGDAAEAEIPEALLKHRVKKSDVEILSDLSSDGQESLFMLHFLSSELDRPAGVARDPRVMFKPDYWQVSVLDAVDRYESALVCAPTSSGKTFICYYAMEKVLRESNDGICIYVAPSKALMNQVEAEIYARFKTKTYPATAGDMHLFGDLEREYMHHPLNCQVLVTVPAMIEQLLMDVSQAGMVSRIRYMVFDEIHCLGDQSQASLLETALALCPCPFVAMSATVGNPEGLCGWLNHVATIKRAPKVNLIIYSERHNDLAKYRYHPEGTQLSLVHPLSIVEHEDLVPSVLDKLALTPQESVLAAACVVSVLRQKAASKEMSKDLFKELFVALCPEDFFASSTSGSLPTKREYRQYETVLKDCVAKLVADKTLSKQDYLTMVELIVARSSTMGHANLEESLWSDLCSVFSTSSTKGGVLKPSTEDLSSVATLQSKHSEAVSMSAVQMKEMFDFFEDCRMLPLLVFNLDRDAITRQVCELGALLSKLQHAKYHGSDERAAATRAENKRRMDAYDALLTRIEMMQKKKRGDDDYDETEATDAPPPPKMVEEEFDAEFSYAGVKALSDPDCEELINSLSFGHKKVDPRVIEALRRGIGMHHEGCSTRLKKVTEILFRRGYLRVVIATGTLSLGIQMPCKAVAFLQSSEEISAVMFRQMAGRAGRRGFDLLGHVVFIGFSNSVVRRLCASRVASVGGDFNMGPSQILKAAGFASHTRVKSQKKSWAKANLSPQVAERALHRATAMTVGGSYAFASGSFTECAADLLLSTDLLSRLGLVTSSGRLTLQGSLAAAISEGDMGGVAMVMLLTLPVLAQWIEAWKTEEVQFPEDPRQTARFKLLKLLSLLVLHRKVPRGHAACLVNLESGVTQDVDLAKGLKLVDKLNAMCIETAKHKLEVTQNVESAQKLDSSSEGRDSSSQGGSFPALSASSKSSLVYETAVRDASTIPGISCSQLSNYATEFLITGSLRHLQSKCGLGVTESWYAINAWCGLLDVTISCMTYLCVKFSNQAPTNVEVTISLLKNLSTEMQRLLDKEGA